MKKYIVNLTPIERKTLVAMVDKGKNKASAIQRAHYLAEERRRQNGRDHCGILYISKDMVAQTQQRFCEAVLGMAR